MTLSDFSVKISVSVMIAAAVLEKDKSSDQDEFLLLSNNSCFI